MQLLLVSRFHVLQQLSWIQLEVVVISILHLDLLFEVYCQFHYFLLARTTDLLYRNAFLVMCWPHIIKFLLEFSILELVLLFFERWLFLSCNWLLIREIHWVTLPIEFRTGLSRGLALQFERIIWLILRF